MKQSKVFVGKTYLFKRTDIEHRKDLIGTLVKITGKKTKGKGRVKWTHDGIMQVHGGYTIYKIAGNRNVSACELEPYENVHSD